MKDKLATGFAALLLPLLVVGCTALPDVQPFADATAQVTEGLKQTGEITVARVANGEKVEPPGEGEEASTAWELQQEWQVRLFAAESLVAYADALAEIAAAGDNSVNAASKLGDTISEIAGQVPGVGALSPAVVDLGQKLVELGIKVKAARNLADAVEEADPAVAGIAEILVADLDDLLRLYKTGYRKVIRERYAGTTEYKKLRDYRTRLHDHVETLRAEAQDFTDEQQIAKLLESEELLARANEAFAPLKESRQALEKERSDFETLLNRTKKTTQAWRQTHEDLASAIRESRRPNWRTFLAEAQELHELAQAIREKNDKADALLSGEQTETEGSSNG